MPKCKSTSSPKRPPAKKTPPVIKVEETVEHFKPEWSHHADKVSRRRCCRAWRRRSQQQQQQPKQQLVDSVINESSSYWSYNRNFEHYDDSWNGISSVLFLRVVFVLTDDPPIGEISD